MPHPTNSQENRPSLCAHGVALEYFPGYIKQTFLPHSLDVLLVSFIVRGRGRHVIGESSFEESGSSIGITHYGVAHDIVTGPEGMDVYNLYLNPVHPRFPVLDPSLQPALNALFPSHEGFLNHFNRMVRIQIDEPKELAATVERLKLESESSAPGAESATQALLSLFLTDCCRAALANGAEPLLSRKSKPPAWIRGLCAELDRDYARPYTIDEVSERLGLSSGYFCRAFKLHTGKTFIHYLTDRRISAALSLLRQTNDKILTIALDCGFNDLTHFNRTFRRLIGQPPGAYRKA